MKINCDDGFNPEWVEDAEFDGFIEIPIVPKPKNIIIPNGLIPFSKIKYSKNHTEFVMFYEYDEKFGAFVRNPEKFYKELRKFPGLISTDNSVYIDSPYMVQQGNVYRNRALNYKLQKDGFYVIPNVRWGNEKTFEGDLYHEPFVFLGLPQRSIVSVSTYGCIKGKENFEMFQRGFDKMVEAINPQIVLVYGAMPDEIFGKYKDKIKLINYPNYISVVKNKNAPNCKEYGAEIC